MSLRGKGWPNGLGFGLTGYRYGAWICRVATAGRIPVKWDGSEGGAEFLAVLRCAEGPARMGLATTPERALELAKAGKGSREPRTDGGVS